MVKVQEIFGYLVEQVILEISVDDGLMEWITYYLVWYTRL